MALMSIANFKLVTDSLGYIWTRTKDFAGLTSAQASPVAGTVQALLTNLQATIATDFNDADQQVDLLPAISTAKPKTNVESWLTYLKPVIRGLETHTLSYGSLVDASIVSVATYLAYYNGGSGGAAFANMLTPDFANLWLGVFSSTALDADAVMSPCLHPTWDSSVSANGMGLKAIGGGYIDGDEVVTASYSPGLATLEVTVNYADGVTNPGVTVAGVDNTGVGTTTWSIADMGTNNPTTAVSTTITPGVTARSRQTVAVASASGIVVGSVMTVNAGLVDAENIIVETVAGTDITAVFKVAHNAGAALTGKRTFALTPSVVGRRLVDVTGITHNIGTHSAGTVRVIMPQSRAAI